MNNKTNNTAKTLLQSLALIALLTPVVPIAQGSTEYKIQTPVDAQIRGASLLAIIEMQDYPKIQTVKLNVSGDTGQERNIAEIPVKIIDILKHNPDIKIPESPVLRIATFADSKNGDELVYPLDINQQVLVSLTPDVLTRKQDKQMFYTIKQDTFHWVDGDSVQILYQGEVVDKLHLDEVRKQVAADAESQKKLAAYSEPEDTNKDFLPATEIQDPDTK